MIFFLNIHEQMFLRIDLFMIVTIECCGALEWHYSTNSSVILAAILTTHRINLTRRLDGNHNDYPL